MSLIDLDSFEAPKGGNGGQIVFCRAKNLPITFKAVGGILPYQSVYDPELKRNRKPKRGDKVSTRYLINGLDIESNVRAYDLGVTTVEAIKGVRRKAVGFGQSPDVYMTITSKGSGMNTEYDADPAQVDKKLNARTVPAEKLLDLHEIVKLIVKDDETPPAASGGSTGGTPSDPDDLAWAA